MILGIMGGMGPAATSYTFKKIINMTGATKDQEHIHIIIDNNTKIPDRTQSILGIGESPVFEMVRSAIKLELMGAEYIFMPCNTAHYFYNEVKKYTSSKIIHMINETVKFIKESYKNQQKFLLLTTTGTYISGVYKNVFEEHDLEIVEPSISDKEMLMRWIYNIKSDIFVQERSFKSLVEKYTSKNKMPVILGCTEFSFLTEFIDLKGGYIDPVEVVARYCVNLALKSGRSF